MSESPLRDNPDLMAWKQNNPKLRGRGSPRICDCGAVVVSKILMECPVCRGLLPKIENPMKNKEKPIKERGKAPKQAEKKESETNGEKKE